MEPSDSNQSEPRSAPTTDRKLGSVGAAGLSRWLEQSAGALAVLAALWFLAMGIFALNGPDTEAHCILSAGYAIASGICFHAAVRSRRS